eukprot:CAMPEP_0168520674 /NCGR_PEP_ID=MMETSP0405-20121227/8168_1 /TAXON_ID=498012 /ORGANISM="Trichosphaerium sp, Strain Am-I-7 wt" /LENGTH=705 /DNA_ID=CAMNT_0008541681 /DNA_START=127 /DNA_END=2241 /DNA_ORIENTATION=-
MDAEPFHSLNILRWIGNFRSISQTSKTASRISLSFSSGSIIREACNFKNIKVIPEIVATSSSGNTFCLTDGCGQLSLQLACRYWFELDLIDRNTYEKLTCNSESENNYLIKEFMIDPKNNGKAPCLFQIRYRGCKGILVTNEDLEGESIAFRREMIKVSLNTNFITILGYADYSSSTLSRVFILLCTQRGVSGEVFRKMQQERFDRLSRVLKSSEDAQEYLTRSKHNPRLRDMMWLNFQGIDIDEPIIKNFLRASVKKELDQLTKKTKLKNSYCCSLYGCIDEYNVLKEDEICINTSRNIPEGTKVLVSRQPLYQAFSLRYFTVRRPKEMCHLKNVVIFSQQTTDGVPLFYYMEKGDLDGDRYFVCWDPQIISSFEQVPLRNIPKQFRYSGKYESSGKGEEILQNVKYNMENLSIDKYRLMCEYFLMYNSTTGILTNYALSALDKGELKKAEHYGNLASQSISSFKHGVSIPIPSERVVVPHYLAKPDTKNFYKSTSVLGELHDDSMEALDNFERIINNPDTSENPCECKPNQFDKTISQPNKTLWDNVIYKNLHDFKIAIDTIKSSGSYKDMIRNKTVHQGEKVSITDVRKKQILEDSRTKMKRDVIEFHDRTKCAIDYLQVALVAYHHVHKNIDEYSSSPHGISILEALWQIFHSELVEVKQENMLDLIKVVRERVDKAITPSYRKVTGIKRKSKELQEVQEQ